MPIKTLLAGLLGLVALAALLASPAAAEQRTSVWQGDFTVPVLQKSVTGTLTTTFDTATNAGSWSFQGMVDGKLATANGRGTFSGDSSSVTLTVTAIESWQMPGLPRPAVPSNATIRLAGNLAYVSYSGDLVKFAGLPVAISAPISYPPQSGTYTLSTAGQGGEKIETLPKTGNAATVGSSLGAGIEMVTIASLMLAGLGGTLVLLRLRGRANRGAAVG